MKKIVFVVEDAIYKNDGYKSRIAMEMDILKDEYDFLLLAPYENKDIEFNTRVNVIKYHAFSSSIPFIFNAPMLNQALRKIISTNPNILVYCEALPSAVAVYKTANELGCKIVFDCHGTAPDEILLYHNNFLGKLYSKWLRNKQNDVVKSVDLIITVSKKQFSLFNTEIEHIVLPMLPAKQFFDSHNYREEYRKKLVIPETTTVFVYSGQCQKWQMAEETIDFYKKIENVNANTFLLILTNEIEKFNKIVTDLKIERYSVISVPYNDVPRYLDTADYGFCLRADHIINVVASPTKVLEYVSRNIRPIITEFVGDYSTELKDNYIAEVVKIDDLFYPKNDHRIDGTNYIKQLSYTYSIQYLNSIKGLC